MTKPKNGNDRMNAKLSFVILPTNETNWPKNGAAWNPNRSQNDNRLEFPPGFGIYKPNAGKDAAQWKENTPGRITHSSDFANGFGK